MTVREALERAATAARAGDPTAKQRRNELVRYALARGAKVRTIAELEREAILEDLVPVELTYGLTPAPIPGQTDLEDLVA